MDAERGIWWRARAGATSDITVAPASAFTARDYSCSECALDHAAVHAQRRARGRRRERARDIRDERCDLFGFREAFDERGWPHLLKELRLELRECFSLTLRESIDEVFHAARARRSRQDAVDRDAGAGKRLGQAARDRE